MKVDIDLAANATSIVWGRRGRSASQVVGKPGRQGVRLYFDENGDVAGLEVLGWSQRAQRPTDVEVAVRAADSGEHLAEDDPLTQAFVRASLETDATNRPLDEGQPMITLTEASAVIGRDRSWLSREMASGRLRGKKIGRTWWTRKDWIESYLHGHGKFKKAITTTP